MDKQEIIDYLYSFNTHADITIEEMADDLAIPSAEPSGDLISRQAVIDSIDKWVKNMGVLIALPAQEVTPLFDSIRGLPSVAISSADMFGDLKAEISMYENSEQSIDEMIQGIKSIISIYER